MIGIWCWGCGCGVSSNSTPSLETSVCCRCSCKNRTKHNKALYYNSHYTQTASGLFYSSVCLFTYLVILQMFVKDLLCVRTNPILSVRAAALWCIWIGGDASNLHPVQYHCLETHIFLLVLIYFSRWILELSFLVWVKGIGLFFQSCLFRAATAANGGSQARGQIGVAAVCLRHSHSKPASDPRLRPTPQFMATPDP